MVPTSATNTANGANHGTSLPVALALTDGTEPTYRTRQFLATATRDDRVHVPADAYGPGVSSDRPGPGALEPSLYTPPHIRPERTTR